LKKSSLSIFVGDIDVSCDRKEKKHYAGSKTPPASIKEKETHWPTEGKKNTSMDLEGGWQPPAPDRDLESNSFF
jgi:hypothetical protein